MNQHPYVLAIDIGTSSCKSVVFSKEGKILAQSKVTYNLYQVGENMFEQDPIEILCGIKLSIKELILTKKQISEISAITFSAQIASQFLVDSQGNPITRMLSWMDKRAEKEVAEYNETFSSIDTFQMTGMDMVMTTAHTSIKLRWMKKHIPELLEKAKYVVQIKEFVVNYLTGNWVSDATSLKGIVNQKDGKVIEKIIDFIGIDSSLIPKILNPYDVAGYLKHNVDGFEFFSVGIPVMVGWNDMNSAFLGMVGLPKGCIAIDLTGTSEHIGIVTPSKSIPEECRVSGVNRVPFLDQIEIFYGVTSSGGQSHEWFTNNILSCNNQSLETKYPNISELAKKITPEENWELLFLPFLEGERHPWNEPNACGVFYGLRKAHTSANLYYSILESVAFVMKSIFERIPILPERIIISGGASRNMLWNQIKANITGLPVYTLSTTEAGCVGAAILAMKHLQSNSNLREIADSMIHLDSVKTRSVIIK